MNCAHGSHDDIEDCKIFNVCDKVMSIMKPTWIDVYGNHLENEKLVSGLVVEQSCFDISNECQDKEYLLVNA